MCCGQSSVPKLLQTFQNSQAKYKQNIPNKNHIQINLKERHPFSNGYTPIKQELSGNGKFIKFTRNPK